jgi:hypothetical protein
MHVVPSILVRISEVHHGALTRKEHHLLHFWLLHIAEETTCSTFLSFNLI